MMLKGFVSKVLDNQKGFTLIELIVVVGIISLLAAAIIPNISRFIGAGDQGAKDAESDSVQHAMYALMSENAVAALNPWAGPALSTNDWTDKPVAGATVYKLYEPSLEYLMAPATQFYYCYDSMGLITQQDEAPALCP